MDASAKSPTVSSDDMVASLSGKAASLSGKAAALSGRGQAASLSGRGQAASLSGRVFQPFAHPRFGTMPAPSRTVTSWFEATFEIVSRAPLGQTISMVTVVTSPRPKWRRGSFEE